MSTSIYVGNLPYSLNEESLNEIFGAFGSVVSAKIITDMNTKRSKGFGFVEMANSDEANNAIKELDNAEINGRNVRVNIAKPKEERERTGRRDNFRKSYR